MSKQTVILVLFFLGTLCSETLGKYGGGTGTPEDPYLIWDANHMNAIGAEWLDLDKCFKLMADIDLSGLTGTSFNIIGRPPTDLMDIALDISAGKIYWSGLSAIQRANLDGSDVEDLMSTGSFVDIDLDLAGGKMYWTLEMLGKIQRANLDGSGIEDLITGITYPWGIALHVSIGKMYWTSGDGSYTIHRANLPGSGIEHLVESGLRSAVCIALDVAAGKMYWLDTTLDFPHEHGRVRRANLDGTGIEGLVDDIGNPGFIALDVAGGKMYWTEWTNGLIQRANFDGSGVEDLLQARSPTGIAVDAASGKMYWAEASEGIIRRANLDGTNVENVVATSPPPFTGIFDGNGHVIANFNYNSDETPYIGLFGYVDANDAEIRDLGLIDPTINTETGNCIGSLVGGLSDGAVTNCYVEGGSVSGHYSVGGLVGVGRGRIENCGFTGTVLGHGNVGGLSGHNYGTITDSHAAGSVSGGEDSQSLGGLFGYNEGAISKCYAASSVSGGNNSTHLGGLCGQNSRGGILSDCCATGSVIGGASCEYLGGLCGSHSGDSIDNCYSTGSVSSENNSMRIGGLVGSNDGSITTSYGTGTVSGGEDSESLGGLCGYNQGEISKCYATGSVSSGNNSTHLGSLCGYHDGDSIDNCYSTGSVTGEASCNYLGGLCGYHEGGSIEICYSAGLVTGGAGCNYLGGLCGESSRHTISNCFWDEDTSGLAYSSGGRGLTNDQMRESIYYSSNGWANGNWTIDQGNDYPHLIWENVPGELITADIPFPGDGTGENPWQIDSPQDLVLISSGSLFWDKHYIVTADIDLNDVSVNPIGYDRYNAFAGSFDGGGSTIHNLTQILPSSDYVGLFGYVTGQVQDLVLSDPNIDVESGIYVGSVAGFSRGVIRRVSVTAGRVAAQESVGGLIGGGWGGIENCTYSGSVFGEVYVGGLVGEGGGIDSCSASGNVIGQIDVGGLVGLLNGEVNSSFSVADVVGVENVGGLVGSMANSPFHSWGYLLDCYAKGSVSGETAVGGLVGNESATTVRNCYSTGIISGVENTGGLVGLACGGCMGDFSGDGWINCFWDVETSGEPNMCGEDSPWGYNNVNGKTTAEMRLKSTFEEWDFLSVWGIAGGQTYPYLRRYLPGDVNKDRIVNFLDLCIVAEQWMKDTTD